MTLDSSKTSSTIRGLLSTAVIALLFFALVHTSTAHGFTESFAPETGANRVATEVEVTMPEGPISGAAMVAGPLLGKSAGLLGKSKMALTTADEAGQAAAVAVAHLTATKTKSCICFRMLV